MGRRLPARSAGASTWPTPSWSSSGRSATWPATGRSTAAAGRRRRVGDQVNVARQRCSCAATRARRATTTRSSTTTSTSLRTLTKLLDDAVGVAPQARPGRGPAGRPARRRRPGPHRPRRHRPGRARAGEHPASSPASPSRTLDELVERDMLTARGRRVPAGLRAGPAVDRVRRAARLRQDDAAVVHARPSSTRRCGWWWPRRCSRPTSRVPNVAQMQTRPARRATASRSTCAGWSPGFLRMAPDVAIVGEVRDREALPLLLTLSSGVTGFTTIHAGSARQALTRLRFVCQLADTAGGLPLAALNTPGEREHRRRRALRPHARRAAGDRGRGRRGPGGRRRRHPVHGHRGVPPRRCRPAPGLDGRAAGPGGPGARPTPATTSAACSTRPRPSPAARLGRPGRRRVTGVVLAACAAAGTYYLYTALVLGWRGLAVGPAAPGAPGPAPAPRPGLAGAGGPRRRPACASSRRSPPCSPSAAACVGLALFGGPLPALALGGVRGVVPRWPRTACAGSSGGPRPRRRGPG